MTLQVLAQVSLKPFNSFGIDVRAQWFAEARSDADVREALAYATAQSLPLLVIGGGSNLLLTQDIQALVLRMATQGVRVLQDDGVNVVVEAEAGEAWHPFVVWTLEHGFCGLENLSLIPGTVGAAPMQNIGAYGVEIKDVFAGLTALDRQTGELRDFSLEACNFAYRDSLFKHETGRWLILRVRFALSRASHLKLDYGPVQQRLAGQGITEATASDVSRAICSIRREKLPDPAELGNAGSFFKNPVLPPDAAESLRSRFDGLPVHLAGTDEAKLSAAWMIEHCGWKGHREGKAGVSEQHALVLVNHGGASGQDILALAERIAASVAETFGVALAPEPRIVRPASRD